MTKQCPIQNLEPVAAGKFRLVHEHPDDRNLLIKVIRPEMIEGRWGSGAPWYKRQRRMRHYSLFLREIKEFLATCAQGSAPSFAQKITGLIETHLGLGLVTEAARDRDGNLAPPLKKLLVERRFDDEARAALERFFEALRQVCSRFRVVTHPGAALSCGCEIIQHQGVVPVRRVRRG